MATCNENGVYQADETFELPRAVKGWCGVALAEIRLADLGTHWIWETGFQLHSGDFWGSGGPLTNHERYRAPTREAAIEAAATNLRKSLGARATEGDKDASAIMAWLETLIPAQLDLFGAAA